MLNRKPDSQNVLYSDGVSNDECYTPEYGVAPIIQYIPRGAVVWCPFDTVESNFVKLLRAAGIAVVHSHISANEDFMTYEPTTHWDMIVSNPPFTKKRETFERALSFNKPFALIMSNTWLNDAAPKQLFREKDLQLLMFDKRMEFLQPNGKASNKITFSSSYYCYQVLPKQLIMATLDKPAAVRGAKRTREDV
jgi:hypothetical protein